MRRKGEISARYMEKMLPHLAVLPAPEGGFGKRLDQIERQARASGEKFAPKDGRPYGHGVGFRRGDQDYATWCFGDARAAADFAAAVGAEIAPPAEKRGRNWRG